MLNQNSQLRVSKICSKNEKKKIKVTMLLNEVNIGLNTQLKYNSWQQQYLTVQIK